MKLFDVVGAVVVITWAVLASLYVWDVEGSKLQATEGLGGEFVMQEGETWLLLRRDKQEGEVGFVHQTRTRIEDGWLLEYDMLMTIDLLGTERAIETKVKSRIDHKGYLEGFSADINASGRSFRARGEVDDKAIRLSLNLGGEPREQTIELQEKPRLSSNALNQLLANGDLEAGEEFSERFFDPTTMQMTEMVLLYKGETIVDVYEEKIPGHHVVQKVAGNELDVYVDDDGEILIQEFPLRMVGARVPESYGRSRASAIRQRFEAKKKEQKLSGDQTSADQSPGFELNLNTAMELLSGKVKLSGQAKPEPAESDAPDDVEPADEEQSGPLEETSEETGEETGNKTSDD